MGNKGPKAIYDQLYAAVPTKINVLESSIIDKIIFKSKDFRG